MARKTPKSVMNLLQRHSAFIDWVDEAIRVKTTIAEENQNPTIRENTVEHWEDMAHGQNAMMENILHEFGCYHGFSYVAPVEVTSDGVRRYDYIGKDHPQFKEWRRIYGFRT